MSASSSVDGEPEPYCPRSMDVQAATLIANWHYPGEYGFYDLSADMEDLAEMFDRTRWKRKTSGSIAGVI